MQKIVIFLSVFLLTFGLANAAPWDFSLNANLMVAQNAYSDNWEGGEAGSMTWTSNANLVAKKIFNPRLSNKNTVKLSYGQTHSQMVDSKKWQSPYKSSDLIDIESLWKFTLGWYADPFVSGRLESQFFDGRDDLKERYFNPMKLTETVGASRMILDRENDEWSVRLGAGFRQYIDRDVLVDALSDERETQTTNDGGLELVSDLVLNLADDRIKYTSKLTVFQALFSSAAEDWEGTPQEDYWQSPDVNFENIFSTSITKYIMIDLYTQLLYDKEIDKAGRFKQTLSLGLTYKFL